jgi:hypothetical protein
VDPREGAFSAELPKAWNRTGGLYRFASVDTRAVLISASPEGDARVTWGDADLPPFVVPNRMLSMAGFGEGSWYSPGYGVRMQVRAYAPGLEFAENYVRRTLSQRMECSGVTVTSSARRTDLTQTINALYARFNFGGPNVQKDAGEVGFSCVRGDQLWKGYYLAVTMLTSTPQGAIWNVEYLIGYLAVAAKAAPAEKAMLRMIDSMQLNPEWVRMQQSLAAGTSEIVARTNQEISAMVQKTFETKWKTEDEVFRRDANARRGVTDVMDPDTGESWSVQSGSRHYWRKPGSDVIVGTQTDNSPGVGYQPLREY